MILKTVICLFESRHLPVLLNDLQEMREIEARYDYDGRLRKKKSKLSNHSDCFVPLHGGRTLVLRLDRISIFGNQISF